MIISDDARVDVYKRQGTLSAKAYDESGNEIKDTLGSASVTTNSDKGSSLAVTAEKTEIPVSYTHLSRSLGQVCY